MLKKLLAVSLLPFSFAAHAEDGRSNYCKNTSFTLWTNSSHPGGNRNNKLNENNGGLGYKCFLEKENPYFYHFDVLENSRHGDAISLGVGRQFSILETGPLRVYAGGALSPTYYEIKDPGKKSRAEFIILPSIHYGIGFELPNKWGTISIEEKRLLGNIRLRSIGWGLQYKF